MLWKFFKRERDGQATPKAADTLPASSNLSGAKPPPAPKQVGYDPYNSGAFKKRDAWDRIIRK